MSTNDVKDPLDILAYLEDNISYGWVGSDGKKRIDELKDARKYYRTMSVSDAMKEKVGTCIEQVNLIKYFLDKLNIPSKMYCTRVYEDETFNKNDEPERMHCFIIFFKNGKVYQIEHPNNERKGIYVFDSEEEAVSSISKIYEEITRYEYKKKGIKRKGKLRRITEFYEIKEGLSFKEFNLYINRLDEGK